MRKPTAPAPVAQVAAPQLPAIITENVRNALMERFVSAFNDRDYDALYEMLGPAARTQIDREKTLSDFRKLAEYFHSVESGAFTHSQLSAQQGDMQIFTLNYSVRLSEESEFGTTARLTINLAIQGGSYQVFGIRLNSG